MKIVLVRTKLEKFCEGFSKGFSLGQVALVSGNINMFPVLMRTCASTADDLPAERKQSF
jgi:hypothetical protein